MGYRSFGANVAQYALSDIRLRAFGADCAVYSPFYPIERKESDRDYTIRLFTKCLTLK